jgi:hypothetical protein
MSGGHYHANDASLTQNQGNSLGDRPCVRQSKLYREHVGGNTMKEILGNGELKWDTNRVQGAYDGQRVHGDGTGQRQQVPQQQQAAPSAGYQQQQAAVPQHIQQTQQPAERAHRPGAAQANRTTYNFMTGQ